MTLVRRVGATATFLISFLVYLTTVAPTTSFWDCGEFIASSYTLGIPHPPGSPLYLLLGRLFTFLPLGDNPAYPVNLMSVLASSLAVAFVYLIAVDLLEMAAAAGVDGVPSGDSDVAGCIARGTGGATAALLLAFSDTFWKNAIEAEVYGFSILLMAMAVWLALLYVRRADRPEGIRILVFSSYLMGLAGGLHLLCLLAAPTLLLFVWQRNRSLLRRPEFWAASVVLFALGYSTYLALYVRSGLNPLIDENNPENWANFMMFLKREQYGAESQVLTVFNRKAPFWDYQIWDMYIKYFVTQFGVPFLTLVTTSFRKATESTTLTTQISLLPLVMGFAGAGWHARRDPWRFVSMAVLFVLTGVGLAVYLNMPDPQPRERDYVFVGSFAVFAVWVGMAAAWAVGAAWRRVPQLGLAAAACCLLLPAGLAVASHGDHDRSNNWVAHDYAYNMLTSCEPDAILFTNGDNDTFPLWFLQEVLGFRKDVRVVNLSLLNTNWYIKQLRDNRPQLQVEYTDSYIDEVLTVYTQDAVVRSDRLWLTDRAVTAAGLTWTIPASSIGILRVQDVMIMKLIEWNRWERPVYFGSTVPDENQTGLRPHLEMEGMVYRLKPEGVDIVNEERIRRNLFEAYRYRGLTDPSVALEENGLELLINYYVGFLQLAEVMRVGGRLEEAVEVVRKCEEVALSPKSWNGTLLLASAMGRLGQSDDVVRLVNQSLEIPGIDPTQQYGSAAELCLNQQMYPNAVALYTEMLERGLGVGMALYNRAVAFEGLGDLDAARDDLVELGRRFPGAEGVQEGLAIIQRKIDARSEALP